FRIELHGDAADVALGIGGAALAGHRGKAGEQRRLLADLREQRGARVAGDVVGDGEGAIGARTLGMHAPLGNHLAVEVGQLLEQPDVLQQGRTAGAGRQDVLVIGNGRAGCGGQFLHEHLLCLDTAARAVPEPGSRFGGIRMRRESSQTRTINKIEYFSLFDRRHLLEEIRSPHAAAGAAYVGNSVVSLMDCSAKLLRMSTTAGCRIRVSMAKREKAARSRTWTRSR